MSEDGVAPAADSTAGPIFTGGEEEGQASVGGLLPFPSLLHADMSVLPGGLFGSDTGPVEAATGPEGEEDIAASADDGPRRGVCLPRQASNAEEARMLAESAVNIGKPRPAMMVHGYG